MATPSYSFDKKTNTITLVIAIPLPNGKLPKITTSFPPKLPLIKLPLVPEALKALAKILTKLQDIIKKLLTLIPGASIRLVVKLGPIPVIDETFTTAEALTAALAFTLCKK